MLVWTYPINNYEVTHSVNSVGTHQWPVDETRSILLRHCPYCIVAMLGLSILMALRVIAKHQAVSFIDVRSGLGNDDYFGDIENIRKLFFVEYDS